MLRRIVLLAALLPGAAWGHDVACTFSSEQNVAAVDHTLNHAFEGAGKQFRVDPDLGKAVAAAESGFDPKAVSSKGAQGLMQLMPDTAEIVHVKNPFDRRQSIYGGMDYLRRIADMPQYAGKPYNILLAYNAGPYRKDFPAESYRYADRVVAIYWQLKGQQHLDHHRLIAPTRGAANVLTLPRCGTKDAAKAGLQHVVLRGGLILPSRPYFNLSLR